MKKKINRREFLVRGTGSLAGLALAGTLTRSAVGAILGEHNPGDPGDPGDPEPSIGSGSGGMVDLVPLGATGLTVSRLAMGTGSIGGGGASNQTRLGQDTFSRIFRHGYERGVRFVDMAESYGSMPFVGRAIEGLPRENLTLLSKIWTHPDGSSALEPVRPAIEKYLRWLGTDHVDVLLMHCMTSGDWNTTRTHYMEGLSRARQDGLVRAVGVSCHNLDALRTAATHPWVDVIMARINPFGTNMDGPPDEVTKILKLARGNGKGVVGMKIFGEGRHVTEPERERSIRYAIHESGIHAMTIGLESLAQLDDAADRVVRIASETA